MPESNGLVERNHSAVLSIIRSCIVELKLPEPYWKYACKAFYWMSRVVLQSKTKKVPFQIVFGKQSTDRDHIRPFGCRVESVHQWRNWTQFDLEPKMEETCISKKVVYIGSKQWMKQWAPIKFNSLDDLTHFPSKRSLQWVTPDKCDDDEGVDIDNKEGHDWSRSGHNLRRQKRKDYSIESLPDAISTHHEPRLKVASASPENKERIVTIEEQLQMLIQNSTLKNNGNPL